MKLLNTAREKITGAIPALMKSSYFKVIFFSALGSILQVGGFYIQKTMKDLSDPNLAILNFGIYILGLLGYVTSSIYNWLLIKLSAIKEEDRFDAIAVLVKKSSVINLVVAVVICIGISLNSYPLLNEEWLILAILLVSNIIGLINIFPQAIAVIKEKFTLTGILALVSPIARTVFTLFFVSNKAVWPLFLAFIITPIFNTIITIISLKKEYNTSFLQMTRKFFITKRKDLNKELKINLGQILVNMLVQLSLIVFFGFDGIILKSLLSDTNYVVYTTYAFLYKFPLFISTSMVVILTAKDLVKTNKPQISKYLAKMLGISLLLIILSYGAVFIVEFIKEGFIMSIVGYGEYFIKGYTFKFGLSWLLNTFVYYLFIYLLKTAPDDKLEKAIIFIYGVGYIIALYLTNSSLLLISKTTAIFASVFIVINIGMIIRQIRLNSAKLEKTA